VALAERTFETLIHTGDLRAALGRRPREPDEGPLAVVAALGVRLLPEALRRLGREHPGRTARLVLHGPAGGAWTLPLSPATEASETADVTVTMTAAEFVYLMGNRRQPGSVPHAVEGDPALAVDLRRPTPKRPPSPPPSPSRCAPRSTRFPSRSAR